MKQIPDFSPRTPPSIHAHYHTNMYTMATQGVILQLFYKQRQKPNNNGPKPITRSLGSKPSSLGEVDTRHRNKVYLRRVLTSTLECVEGKKREVVLQTFPLSSTLPPKVRTLPLSLSLPSAMQKVSKLTRTHAYRHVHTEKYHSDLECSHAGFV